MVWIIYFVLRHQASSHNFISVIFGIFSIFRMKIFLWKNQWKMNNFQISNVSWLFHGKNFENVFRSIFCDQKSSTIFFRSHIPILKIPKIPKITLRKLCEHSRRFYQLSYFFSRNLDRILHIETHLVKSSDLSRRLRAPLGLPSSR